LGYRGRPADYRPHRGDRVP